MAFAKQEVIARSVQPAEADFVFVSATKPADRVRNATAKDSAKRFPDAVETTNARIPKILSATSRPENASTKSVLIIRV